MLNRLFKKFFVLKSFVGLSILIFVLLIGTGCSQSDQLVKDQLVQADKVIVEENDKIIDQKSVDSIEHVLTSEFTSPKLKYNKIIQNSKNFTIVGGEKVVKASSGSELYKYIEGLYKSSFTEAGFEKFFISSAFKYTLQSKDVHIKVNDISIKKNKDDEQGYDFIVKVKYQKNGGTEKDYNIKGIVTLPEKGKISEITYLDDGGLMQKIKNNS
ncbi:hypothetical protein [Rummeliibacillus sp. SL167]|uniref:hypothetical protein n=1 Tax=Rummeliibacillus sp. SL167 TaxID=2579792 RepID=UPI0011B4530F|nr:hypothetical protein [Rummeliibacillus sp. SL167]